MARRIIPNNLLLDQVVELIKDGESVELLTKGVSMHPFIVGGKDSVIISPLDGAVAVGDIILAKTTNDKYVIHRIEHINGTMITLMGDGNRDGREQCHIDNAKGRVTSIIHKGKRIDCNSPKQRRRARIWYNIGGTLRKAILAIWRRTILKLCN